MPKTRDQAFRSPGLKIRGLFLSKRTRTENALNHVVLGQISGNRALPNGLLLGISSSAIFGSPPVTEVQQALPHIPVHPNNVTIIQPVTQPIQLR